MVSGDLGPVHTRTERNGTDQNGTDQNGTDQNGTELFKGCSHGIGSICSVNIFLPRDDNLLCSPLSFSIFISKQYYCLEFKNYLMYKLHEKSPQSGTERSKKVFTRGLNRSVPFHFTAHFSEPSTFRNGTERF